MGTFQEHKSISAVIPTLDAEDELPGALAALTGSELINEVIVSDGGSQDGTVAVAQAAGARVVTTRRGRGFQLIAGAEAASGQWLLFLHADCRLASRWETPVTTFIDASGAAGRAGYFAFTLDDPDLAARRLERIVAWRCRVFGLPYGDQGLLISRALYDAVGGFAPIPLMEDVDLVHRLGRGRLVPLAAPIIASARRYRRGGYWRRPLRNLLCLGLYFAGVPPRHIARLYG